MGEMAEVGTGLDDLVRRSSRAERSTMVDDLRHGWREFSSW